MNAMSTPVSEAVPVSNIADRAAGYGMPGVVVDGNDVGAVAHAVAEARQWALEGKGASLIECKTYRLSGHSRGDQRRYRSREEEQHARCGDPIVRLRNVLMDSGLMDEEADEKRRDEVHHMVQEAVAYAEQSPLPRLESMEEGVYA